jgi:hypothetical protein
MLTVHQMALRNLFLTGISSGYDKNAYQNEPNPITTLGFTGDCVVVGSKKESSNKPVTAFTGTEILNYSSTKPGVGLVPCARGFYSIIDNFEIETARSNKFLQLFTCYVRACRTEPTLTDKIKK